ncbi:MAG: DUF29 domain-containing protein [Thermocrinis sp.]|jgi:hypothetical protein|uniref:DUF29 domain-containing protein n=1 Tax=Thermocrinis sp. TaxID=2024383 RepID=UPI003C11AA19
MLESFDLRASLKELYEKDFYLWVQENLRLLQEKKYDLVDWENLLEEIRDLGEWYVDRVIDLMIDILENLYRWENFIENEDEGHEWIERISDARTELDVILIRHPSIKAKAQEKENIQTAWELAVYSLINWFEEPKNHQRAKSCFGRFPTEEDFPKECPYSFRQILDYEPWVRLFNS